MDHHGRRGSVRSWPEEAAAAYRLGAQWREEWRAEKAAAKKLVEQAANSHSKRLPDDTDRRRSFAKVWRAQNSAGSIGMSGASRV
jgi:hypothetical protein